MLVCIFFINIFINIIPQFESCLKLEMSFPLAYHDCWPVFKIMFQEGIVEYLNDIYFFMLAILNVLIVELNQLNNTNN